MPIMDSGNLQCFPPRVSGMILFAAKPSTASSSGGGKGGTHSDYGMEIGAMCTVPKDKATAIISSGIIDETIAVA